MDSPQPKSNPLVPVLSIGLILVACIAGYFGYKYSQSQDALASETAQFTQAQATITSLTAENAEAKDNVAALTSQVEESQKQIAELQPLAEKARTLPIRLTINQHAANAGYNVFAFNLSRSSLRFVFTINGGRKINAVIDGGKFFVIRALASGDTLAVDSKGYDTKTVTIQ
jgi:cell division protein FtsB